jgi:hypothetical protein
MKDFDPHNHVFGSEGFCFICDAPAPQIPAFLKRQTPDPRNEQIADLTAKLAEAETDNRQLRAVAEISMQTADELRATINAQEVEIVRLQHQINCFYLGTSDERLLAMTKARDTAEARLRELREAVREVVDDAEFHITVSGAERLQAALAKSGEP